MMSTYFEDCTSITTKFLRANGFFKSNRVAHCDLKFISNGEVYDLKIVASTMELESPLLIFQYSYNGEKKRLNIELIPRYNHLGGIGYKFKCPKTGRGCYNLYFINGEIASRYHFKLLYRSQIRSQRVKDMDKDYGIIFKAEKARKEINSYRFKKYHKGKMTKRYKRCLKAIKEAEGVSLEEAGLL
ncbi:hypothetical protein F8C76_15660 [Flagellimonas olearia]|uniref:Uncharacterized protein n=1 Tax=Flagellimonas olearia TaxID=552546 RepID=A0A6I1E706_9FLAO|nr:hypothetical protein [Allomuricauda olearia]KAB7529266.1 hypothetical protein F8C76_15660 [Allomuricauda olearia]